MSKHSSQLDKVQKLVDEIYNDSDNNIALFAVELDEKGYPLGRMQKMRATPGVALGAISILEEALMDAKSDTMKKIDLAGDLSEKMTALFKKLGIEDPSEIEESLGKITDPEMRSKLKEAIKKIKDQF
jgi:hypothetical protein